MSDRNIGRYLNIGEYIKQTRFVSIWRAVFFVCHTLFGRFAPLREQNVETHSVLIWSQRVKKRRHLLRIHTAKKIMEPAHRIIHAKLTNLPISELSEQEYRLLVEYAETCSTCVDLLRRDAIVEQWLQGMKVREPLPMDATRRPDLPFPQKILRKWEFQEEQERILSYSERKKMYAGKKREKGEKHVFSIAILLGSLFVLIFGLVMLLNLIVSHSIRFSGLFHNSAQLVGNLPEIVNMLSRFVQHLQSHLVGFGVLAAIAGVFIADTMWFSYRWRLGHMKRRSERQLQKKADSIVRGRVREQSNVSSPREKNKQRKRILIC